MPDWGAGVTVVQNIPGEIVVIDIPLTALEGFGNEISFKSILKDVVPPKLKKIKPQTVSMVATNHYQYMEENAEVNENISWNIESAPEAISAPTKSIGHGMSSFATYVEEMERKYQAQHIGDAGSSDDDDDDEDGENDDMNMQEGLGGASDGESDCDAISKENIGRSLSIKSTGTAKKRRRVHEYYDYDDAEGFIDDTEAESFVLQALTAKKKKTKQSGFFLSAGELEVEMDSNSGFSSSIGLGGSPERKSKAVWIPTPGTLAAIEVRNMSQFVLIFCLAHTPLFIMFPNILILLSIDFQVQCIIVVVIFAAFPCCSTSN